MAEVGGVAVVRPRQNQGLYRVLMVLGSMAPLFIFLAIRGAPVIDGKPIIENHWYRTICAACIALPAAIIGLRVARAGKLQDTQELTVGSASDHRDHLLVYLFAMLIPLYQNNYSSVEDVWAALAVLVFVAYLFVHLNLHYMNLVFSFAGYRVYTVETQGENRFSGRCPFVLITKRQSINPGQRIDARRISDTVFIEYER